MTAPRQPIHKAKRVPVRQVFAHEAHDFTVWLETNIDALSAELGFDLTVLSREHTIGPYRIDLLCQDGQDRRVIIENQLEVTDLNHLGQVVMYLVNIEAKTAIWVATGASNEFRKVVTWLNESTPADISFYLVKAEAISLDDSAYAPLFTVLVGPDPIGKAIGTARKAIAQEDRHGLQFSTELLAHINARTNLFATTVPKGAGWLGGISFGKPCMFLWCGFFESYARVQINIEPDSGCAESTQSIYEAVYARKTEIEHELGQNLVWRPPDAHKTARIHLHIHGFRRADPGTWPASIDKIVGAILRFDQVFRPIIEALEI